MHACLHVQVILLANGFNHHGVIDALLEVRKLEPVPTLHLASFVLEHGEHWPEAWRLQLGISLACFFGGA